MKKLGAPFGRRWVMAFATFGLALLSGHFVQDMAFREAPWKETEIAVALPVDPSDPSELNVPPRLTARVLETRLERAGTCLPNLMLEETPNGDLSIDLHAPCHASTPVELRVNSLVADVKTDATGRLNQRIPALSPEVSVVVRLGERTLSAQMALAKSDAQQLVALAWSGPQTFFIRADSTGAGGDEIPGAFTRVGHGEGASFEIFSSSALDSLGASIVRLSVETKVTEENCGRHVSTLAYQTSYLGDLRPTEIAYTMPDCDRVGDVVRLQNLLRDMRLALR